MGKLERKLVTPQSILIEQTALSLAAAYYEQGRSLGLTSRYKNPQQYAKRYVERFIPSAVSILMDMLGSDATKPEMKEMIYEAFMERVNDEDLSYQNTGLKAFDIPVDYKSDKFIPPKPLEWRTGDRLEDLPMDLMLSPVKKTQINKILGVN